MRALRSTLIVACTIFALNGSAFAHVGSNDVYYDGSAGPYRLFVNVTMPQVIPGVAEVGIRSETLGLDRLQTTITRLSGAGAEFAPTPDIAVKSPQDPQFFSSSLWLMEPGELRILVLAEGAQGKGQMSVPLPSFAQRTLTMDPLLRDVLLVLLATLCVSMVFIVRGAFREGGLQPGEKLTAQGRREGIIGTVVTAGIVGWVVIGGSAWWTQEAARYDAERKFFEPPKTTATVKDGILRITPADQEWSERVDFRHPISDHGHPMHLFLLREPGLDRFWHLHPEAAADGAFEVRVPPIDPGKYRVFADVVDKSGFPWTMVGTVDVRESKGATPTGDDSGAVESAMTTGDSSLPTPAISKLADGGTMAWARDSTKLKSGVPMMLKFRVIDRDGNPVKDLEPYMGMAAHAVIVRSDFSVFAHVHPSGSVPMASLMLVSADSTNPGGNSGMVMAGTPIASEIRIPYGFPRAGDYRLFVQVKRQGQIETGAFDAHVE